MLDFSVSDEQQEIRLLAQRIAVEHLRPRGREAEKSGALGHDLWQTLAQTGLLTPFPEAYGGSGTVTAMTWVLIAEELGCGDPGLAMHILGAIMGPLAVLFAGDERQQAQYIPPFCEGQPRPFYGALAFAEHGGRYAVDDIHATVIPGNGHILLNGMKRAVIHGADASLCVVLVRFEQTEGLDGLRAVVLPVQVEGVQISATEQVGLMAAPTVSYTFTDVFLPTESLLAAPGYEGSVRAATLFLLLRAGVACGIARAALEYAGQYAQGRVAFGRPIVSYQGIAFMLAEMAMKLDAARLLLWHAAMGWDNGIDPATLVRDVEAAQGQAVKIAQAATIDAVQIMGGAGFLQDHPVEMWMRAAAALE